MTFEEVNEALQDDFPVEKIEFLINGMIEQGIKNIDPNNLMVIDTRIQQQDIKDLLETGQV